MDKYSLFAIGSTLVILFGVIACRFHRRFVDLTFILTLTAMVFPTYGINFLSREFYRSQTRGFEIHLTDLLIIVLISALLTRPSLLKSKLNNFIYRIPLLYPYLLFFFFCGVSWLFVEGSLINPKFTEGTSPFDLRSFYYFETSLYHLFEMSKLLKGFFVYLVFYFFFLNKQYVKYFIYFCGILVICFTITSLINRYVYGMHRVTVLYHINVFNCIVSMLGAMFLPVLFEEKKIEKVIFNVVVVMGALLTIVLTISRASLLAFVILIAMTSFIYFFRRLNFKNLSIIFVMGIFGLLIAIKSGDTLFQRFFVSEATDVGLSGRELMNLEAWYMAKDHFFGVGLGNFPAYATTGYAELVGLPINELVHNLWYLTVAEVGFLGLLAFVIYWLRVLQINVYTIIFSFKKSDPLIFTTSLGCFLALLSFNLQLLFHFAWRDTSLFYFLQVFLALLASQYIILKSEREREKRALRSSYQTELV